MAKSVEAQLSAKGIKANPKTLAVVTRRWQAIQEMRKEITKGKINDADISLKNIAGGDHIE